MSNIVKIAIWFIAPVMLLACAAEDSSQDHLNRALSYFETGEDESALIELKNTLRMDPNNPDARWLLGKYQFAHGNCAAAVENLSKVIASGMFINEATPLFARCLLEINDLTALLEVYTEGLSESSRAIVLAAQGLGRLGLGENTRARILMEEAMSSGSELPYVRIAQLRLSQVLGDIPKEQLRVDTLAVLSEHPEDPFAWRFLGQLAFADQDLEAAEEAFTNAIDRGGNGGFDLLRRASVRIEMKEYSTAREDIQSAQAILEGHPYVSYLKGLLALGEEDLEAAKGYFDDVIAKVEENDSANFYVALTNFRLGNLAAAENAALKYNRGVPDDVAGASLLASILIQQGSFARAASVLEPFLANEEINDSVRLLYVGALLQQGEVEKAGKTLRTISAENLESKEQILSLSAAQILSGEDALGLKYLRRVIELDPGFYAADELLISTYLSQGEQQLALEAAHTLVEKDLENVRSLNVLGKTYMAVGDRDKATDVFLEVRRISPGDPTSLRVLSQLAIADKDFTAAEKYLREIIDVNDNAVFAYVGLANLYALQNQPEKMVEALNAARESDSTALQPRMILAQHYLISGDPEAALSVVNELTNDQKRLAKIVEVRAKAYLALRDYDGAQVYLEEWSGVAPENPEIYLLLSKVYAEKGDPVKVRANLNKSLELSPANLSALVSLARLDLYENKLALFADHIEILKEIAPTHPDVRVLAAENLRIGGNAGQALKQFEELYRDFPTREHLVFILRQLEEMKDYDRVLEWQNEWLSQNPGDMDMMLRAASVYDRQGNTEAANQYYQIVLDSNPTNTLALNNFAWNLKNVEPGRAVSYAKTAVDLDPRSAQFLDTYAMSLMSAGDLTNAKKIINKALAIQPKDPDLMWHHAMIESSLGNKKEAMIVLESIIDKYPEYSNIDEVKRLLQSLNTG